MNRVPVEALQDAIRNLHGCESRWVETVSVHETYEGATVWGGEVQVFALIDHPTVQRAYAWAYETDEGTTRYLAVLHQGPVDSPRKAVQAAILSDAKKGENPQ